MWRVGVQGGQDPAYLTLGLRGSKIRVVMMLVRHGGGGFRVRGRSGPMCGRRPVGYHRGVRRPGRDSVRRELDRFLVRPVGVQFADRVQPCNESAFTGLTCGAHGSLE